MTKAESLANDLEAELSTLKADLARVVVERDVLQVTCDEGCELIGELTTAYAAVFGEPLEPCRADTCVGHLGEKARTAMTAALASWADLKADLARVSEERMELFNALERETRLWRLDSESSLQHFERVADWYYSETGRLRPGKDEPLAASSGDPRKRDEDYAAWIKATLTQARAAIARARQQGATTGGGAQPPRYPPGHFAAVEDCQHSAQSWYRDATGVHCEECEPGRKATQGDGAEGGA